MSVLKYGKAIKYNKYKNKYEIASLLLAILILVIYFNPNHKTLDMADELFSMTFDEFMDVRVVSVPDIEKNDLAGNFIYDLNMKRWLRSQLNIYAHNL